MTWFGDWSSVLRVLVFGTAGYFVLIAMLRVTGKRTLSKLNAFDFVITIALGSTFANLLLSSSVAFVDGITALGLLIALQLGVTWFTVRSRSVARLIKSEPRLLVFDGEFLPGPMRDERITKEEVLAAMRAQSMASLRQVRAVVLETEGAMTVIPVADAPTDELLDGVRGAGASGRVS